MWGCSKADKTHTVFDVAKMRNEAICRFAWHWQTHSHTKATICVEGVFSAPSNIMKARCVEHNTLRTRLCSNDCDNGHALFYACSYPIGKAWLRFTAIIPQLLSTSWLLLLMYQPVLCCACPTSYFVQYILLPLFFLVVLWKDFIMAILLCLILPHIFFCSSFFLFKVFIMSLSFIYILQACILGQSINLYSENKGKFKKLSLLWLSN